MFQSMQQRGKGESLVAIDIAPLIDVVFILLLFFLVTASFVRETGVDVQRPQASTGAALSPDAMRLSITESGAVYTEGQRVELPELQLRVRSFLSSTPGGPVIVIPDVRVPSGRLIEVMDAARAAGAVHVAIATTQPPRT